MQTEWVLIMQKNFVTLLKSYYKTIDLDVLAFLDSRGEEIKVFAFR